MYCYNRKSKEKIIHKVNCFHLAKTKSADIVYFESLEEAYKYGFKLCKHCSKISEAYRKEKKDILSFCAENGLSSFLTRDRLIVTAPCSQWIIIFDENEEPVLYHKNTYQRKYDYLNKIYGYHRQYGTRENSIVAYLGYIIQHEYFRAENPLHFYFSSSAQKGTKRYRKEQEKKKRTEKRFAVKNVLNLIESLQVQSV